MAQQLKHYEFINVQTGNVIAYITLSGNIDDEHSSALLEQKKNELAVANRLNFELIYWQDTERSIR